MELPLSPALSRSVRAVGLPLGALALLAACTATLPNTALPHHVAPTTGPSARLVIRGSVSAGDVYGVYVHDDALNCTGSRLAAAGSSTRQPTATNLVADQLTTLEFMLVKPDKKFCFVRWSFTPASGRTYLVRGASTGPACAAQLLDATDPDAIKPEPGAVRRNVATQACVALAAARAAQSSRPLGGQSGNDAVLNPGATADDLKGLLAP